MKSAAPDPSPRFRTAFQNHTLARIKLSMETGTNTKLPEN